MKQALLTELKRVVYSEAFFFLIFWEIPQKYFLLRKARPLKIVKI